MTRLLAALATVFSLAGCAGGGPFGTGLGEVTATIAVTDPAGGTCKVDLRNGKDQTGLTLKGLHVCGGTLDELHADKSDGAASAIAANADVTKTLGGQAIALGGALAQTAITAATGGIPIPKPPAPPAAPAPEPLVAPMAAATPDPMLTPGLWYEDPLGNRRHLESVGRGAACWRSDKGAEHCANVAEWLSWRPRPLAAGE